MSIEERAQALIENKKAQIAHLKEEIKSIQKLLNELTRLSQ